MAVVLGYARQSEKRRGETVDDSLSLDAQDQAIRAWAAREGHVVARVVRDHDVRGRDPHRPGLRELDEWIAASGAEKVVVHRMDRFFRENLQQELKWRELRARGVGVVSLTEPGIEHTLMRGVLGVVNQYFTEQLSATLTSVFAARHQRGLHHGEAPYGFVKCDGRLIPDPSTAPVVAALIEGRARGATLWALLDDLLARGVPSAKGGQWTSGTILAIVRNPAYAGGVVRRGEVVWDAPGVEPIVGRDLWSAAQRRGEGSVRPKVLSSWLESAIYHAEPCGARLYLRRTTYRDRPPIEQFVCRTAFYPRGHRCEVSPRSIGRARLEDAALLALAHHVVGLGHDQPGPSTDRGDEERAAAARRLARIATARQRVYALFEASECDLAHVRARRLELDAEEAAARAVLTRDGPDDLAAYLPRWVALIAGDAPAGWGEVARAVGGVTWGPAGVRMRG